MISAGATPIHEIGEAIELRAEARRAFQKPGQTAVETIQDGGEDDGRERQPIAVLERHPDAGQPGAECEQCNEVRRERPHRYTAEPPAPLVLERRLMHGHACNIAFPGLTRHRAAADLRSRPQEMVKLRLGCRTFRSARTVSPAVAICPSPTRGVVPSGR